ncbi:MAG: DHH family phosphoesterase, partial [Oscillospiraceae bacterium]|nr:DHH family phosphoesterase [Oscillospiraceae bacterium]
MDAGYPYLVSSVLVSRGITNAQQAAEALEQERTLDYSPFLMQDMDRAVARITRALADREVIAVFGDYDVDGITSTCLLTDYLRSRGAEVKMHIPRRIEEGYGLGCDAIRALAEEGVSLIITVDCGITGVEETAYAATLGVDLVITDHHECKDVLPAAVAVVDPHRPDCPYPFKHLAGVGVALKLVLALGGSDREDALFARYCSLAAIGTIADVMRMEGENRTIVHCGLEALDHTDFIGLHALLR